MGWGLLLFFAFVCVCVLFSMWIKGAGFRGQGLAFLLLRVQGLMLRVEASGCTV